MSLVTRCPRCKTLFRVMPGQLQTHSGQVRCGRCMNVFDGFQGLAVEQPDALSEVHFEPDSAAVAKTAKAPAPATARPVAKPEAKVAQPALQAKPQPDSFTAPSKPFGERLREATAARLQPLRKKVLRPPTPAGKRIAACVLLGVLLAAQMAYAFRSQLAARSFVARAALTSVCDLAGCSVSLPQRPDLLKIEASDVHMIDAAKPSLIQLTATLRSYAGYDLAYPALDLVLTNANEHALARRIFIPGEYLDQTRDPKAGVPPHAEITVALDLDTGDLNAAGFRLDLLAAPAP